MKRESGQATMELITLLIGFVAVFLGLIFICSLADSDIDILLRARNNAEERAASAPENASSGAEFANVVNVSHDIYDDKPALAFSPHTPYAYSHGNTIASFPAAFSDQTRSVPSAADPLTNHHARLDSWMNLREVDPGVFKSDFVSGLPLQNALEAAELVSGTSNGADQFYLLSRQKKGTVRRLHETFFTWFGIRVGSNTLENAPGNRVFMPVTR